MARQSLEATKTLQVFRTSTEMFILKLLKILEEQWEKWDLRSFILLSLFLQIFINIFTPLRKRTTTAWVTCPIWVAYLLSDWAANYAVGLIASSQKVGDENSDLFAFWAPFLMVHLGGPDTITAYAVEDNKLWLRHLFSLIFQSLSAIYVFIQSLPQNQLLIPNVLMFISGLYKYSERTVSLYNARTDSEAVPDYAKLLEELDSRTKANIPAYIQLISVNNAPRTRPVKDELNATDVVLYAYEFFESLKDFTGELIVGVRQRDWFRGFFLQRTQEDAFGIIEVELNFIYEVLFTKVGVVYSKYGYSGRFISFGLVFTSFFLFYYNKKVGFQPPDVAITYTLLIGAIVLDAIAFIRIFTSDWFRVRTKKPHGSTAIANNKCSDKVLCFLQPGWDFFDKIPLLPVLRRRWSENVLAYSLIACCLNLPEVEMQKFIDMLDLTDLLDSNRNVKCNRCNKELKDHIFEELKMKSNIADDLDTAKEITAARGGWILRYLDCNSLLPFVDMDFDQSLLIWHIATEICYYDEERTGTNGGNKFRHLSKVLSDYMVYLLIKQPAMMSAVSGIGQIRFRDTMEEAKIFYLKNDDVKSRTGTCHVIIYVVMRFLKRLLSSPYNLLCSIVNFFVRIFKAILGCTCTPLCEKTDLDEERLKEEKIKFCKKILGVPMSVDPDVVKGDGSKSVLFQGCKLAKEMIEMEAAKKVVGYKWEIVSKVWVEMLCYAAMHCSPNTHAIQLSKGGELATLVWLLMVHFGFGSKFQDVEDQFRASIVGDK